MDQQRSPAVVFVTRAGLALLAGILAAALFIWATPAASARAGNAPGLAPVPAAPYALELFAAQALTLTESLSGTAPAADAAPAPVPTLPAPSPDATCLTCHAGHEGTKTLASGEELPLGIDPTILAASVHGAENPAPVYCTDCHSPKQRYQFPHVPTDAQSIHDFESDIAQNCQKCHTSAELHNPGHVLAAEDAALPNCVDCHGGHDVTPVDQAYADPVAFCQDCHAIADMENDQLRSAHEDAVPNLAAGESCLTCHTDQPQTPSQQCVECHSRLSQSVTLATGEEISLHVDQVHIDASVHGNREIDGVQYSALQCADCHRQFAEAGFPHQELPPESRKELRLRVEENCVTCHEGVASSFADGVHAHALQEGELNAASCADCHGSHDIQSPNIPRSRISETCGTCHEEIFAQYAESVHGESLFGRQNPDVPVCTDCHGVHSIANPTEAQFRLSSPQMCGTCHADKELMAEYGISTEVFESYVADFHGTTVTLFAHDSPNEPTNKAVCYDCHGIHDIQRVSEASQEQIQARLLVTCQNCHPDANENFPASWMGHYQPSLEHYPLVYLVNLFYILFIPVVLGGFLLFIGTDIFRRGTDWLIARRKRRS